MVNVGGGDQQDVLVRQRVQSAFVGLATADVDVIIEASGIGPPGASGNTVLSGHGPPSEDEGKPGDFYLDLDTSDLYGPRGADVEAPAPVPVPLSHVETYNDSEVPGAAAALADSSDATAVRISSSADADWFLHLAGSLVGTSTFEVVLRFNVISHGSQPFVFRAKLRDQDWTDAEVNFQATLEDGFTDYLLRVDQTWLDSHPYNPPNPDQGSAWTSASVDGAPEDYNDLVTLLGTTPVLHVRGYDGSPYEVDLVHAEVVEGSGGSVWGVPTSLAGALEVYEQPEEPDTDEVGVVWIDTDSTVVADEYAGGLGSAMAGMAARARGFVDQQSAPLTEVISAATIRPDVLYPPDWTGPVEGWFDVDPAQVAGEWPITALSPISVSDPAGPGLDPNWRGVLTGGCTVHRAGLQAVVHKVVDTAYPQASAPIDAATGAWSVDLTELPMTRHGTWAVSVEDTTTAPPTQLGEMWPAGLGYAELHVEHRVISDESYVVNRTYAAASGRFRFGDGLPGRKHFRLVRKSDGAILAEWLPSLGAVRSYLPAPGETGYGEPGFTGRTFAYDQALVTFAAVASGDQEWARECVRGLLALQTTGGANDGGFLFSGPQLNPATGDGYYRTGNHAICTDAVTAYLQAFPQDHTADYEDAVRRGLDYLETRRSVTGATTGLYTGGTGGYPGGVFDPSVVITWASSEHNFDSWQLLTRAAEVLDDSAIAAQAQELGDTIEEKLWDPVNARFFQGMQPTGSDPADPLDCRSWGAMFLAGRGKHAQARTLITDAALAPYRFTRNGGTGYAPARPGDPEYPDAAPTVWPEGTFGVALAQLAVGDEYRWYRTITEVMPLQNEDGSYPYVTDAVPAYEWTSSKSVIGCAWGMLAVMGHGIWGVEAMG